MLSKKLFSNGSILYFNPFHFIDGGFSKPKYFIVLKKTGNNLVLASLPTSKDTVPSIFQKTHGCIDMPEINFNCYYFSPETIICKNGFSFPLETYIYGFRLCEYNSEKLLQQEEQKETKITLCGILKDTEYKSIIQCLSKSASVKRKYRRTLIS